MPRRQNARKSNASASKAYVKRQIAGQKENKYHLVNQATGQDLSSAIDSPVIDDLCDMAQGDSNVTMDGNRCKLKSLRCNYRVKSGNTATQNVRIMLVQVYDESDITAGNFEVLQQTSGDNRVLSGYSTALAHGQKFKVLGDHKHTLASSASTDGRNNAMGSFFIPASKMGRKIIRNQASTLGKNHIFIFAVSDVSANYPTLTYSSELVFEDL